MNDEQFLLWTKFLTQRRLRTVKFFQRTTRIWWLKYISFTFNASIVECEKIWLEKKFPEENFSVEVYFRTDINRFSRKKKSLWVMRTAVQTISIRIISKEKKKILQRTTERVCFEYKTLITSWTRKTNVEFFFLPWDREKSLNHYWTVIDYWKKILVNVCDRLWSCRMSTVFNTNDWWNSTERKRYFWTLQVQFGGVMNIKAKPWSIVFHFLNFLTQLNEEESFIEWWCFNE